MRGQALALLLLAASSASAAVPDGVAPAFLVPVIGGKAKEAFGKATGDDSTEAEGKIDQAKASIKDAVENVKDAFKK